MIAIFVVLIILETATLWYLVSLLHDEKIKWSRAAITAFFALMAYSFSVRFLSGHLGMPLTPLVACGAMFFIVFCDIGGNTTASYKKSALISFLYLVAHFFYTFVISVLMYLVNTGQPIQ